jgi:hypothetical protein
MQAKITAYQKHGKWKDLEKFLVKNQEVVRTFQKEFDELIQEIHRWKKVNIRDFTQEWNDASKRRDPFSE